MSRTSTAVNRYIADRPPAVRAALEVVREAIQKALPDADEVISYQIPACRVHGRVAIFFAGWKSHVAIYPATAALVAAFGDELAPFVVSKGTIRFPLDEAVPARLVRRIAAFRGRETMALIAAKQAKRARTVPAARLKSAVTGPRRAPDRRLR